MQKRLAAIAAQGRYRARAFRCSVLLAFAFGGIAAAGASADVARGVAWLESNVTTQGQLVAESRVAVQQQARCETARTLRMLATSNSSIGGLVASLDQPSVDAVTESLACWVQLRESLGEGAISTELTARQLMEQGYAPQHADRSPAALDTGWALGVQPNNLPAATSSQLLDWLHGIQRVDGSFAVAGRSDLLSTAVVVRGLTAHASINVTAAAIVEKASAYLFARQSTAGVWAQDAVTTAIVYEALHPYTSASAATANSVEAFLRSQQQADGSWDADPYVTAVALRALALVPVAPLHPAQSGLRVKFIDARTGGAVPGVTLQGGGAGVIEAVTSAVGTIDLNGLNPGAYQLQANGAGYASVAFSITVKAGQKLDLGTVLLIVPKNATTAVIAGTVRDNATHQPLGGATVTVQGQTSSAVSASDGTYLVSNVTPGTIAVVAGKPGYDAAAATLSAQSGQVVYFSPALVASTGNGIECKIVGTIRDATTQQPVAGVSVALTGVNNASAISDSFGRFSTPNLASGQVMLSASKAGYDSVSVTSTLSCSPAQATSMDFSPKLYGANQSPANANTAGLRGTVMDAGSNQPIAGAQITVVPQVGPIKTTASQDGGGFAFSGLNGGNAQLQVLASGYQGVTLQYALTPLEETDLAQVRLRPLKVEQLVPDFKLISVKRATARTDPQTLRVSGAVDAQVANVGTQSAAAGIPLLAFVDVDRNDQYQAGVDLLLGQGVTTASLAPQQTSTLQIGVTGVLPFRDAPIHVVVDPDRQSTEVRRDNNVRSSAQDELLSPVAAAFKPKLKWQWSGSSLFPTYNQVMMTPVIGRFVDTNGDGVVDQRDHPCVIFATFFPVIGASWQGYGSPGVVRVLDGVTGAELMSIPPGLNSPAPMAGLVLADLDGDGNPELVGITVESRAVAYSNKGVQLWTTSAQVGDAVAWNVAAQPSVADLDGDGKPELVYSKSVLNSNGTSKWQGTGDHFGGDKRYPGSGATTAAIADLFESGQQNVILGGSVYASDGRLIWQIGGGRDTDGFSAVADFDGNGIPSIVVSGQGYLSRYTREGELLWRIRLPETLYGGPPTIADADGDGRPDIGVATGPAYRVYRHDGTLLWGTPTQDTSLFTGSTFFDFDGDGTSEVIYADETRLRAFNGSTGELHWSIPNSSGTAMEYPVVADVDSDGSADIVVVGNNYAFAGNTGVRVFQDENNAWVRARDVWNQHAYSITNINDDLSVPRNPVPSWKSHNTFRVNKRIDGDPRAVADLTAGYVRVTDGGANGISKLTVRLGNAGSYPVPAGTPLVAYSVNPALGQPGPAGRLGVASLAQELQSGHYQDVDILLSVSLSSLGSNPTVWFVGDDDGAGKTSFTDFDRSNNTIAADLSSLAVDVGIAAAVDKPSYSEADQSVFTAVLSNGGSLAQQVHVRFTVLDAAGRSVEILSMSAAATVLPGASASVQGLWPLGGVLAGHYQLLAELVTPGAVVYGAAAASFTVTATQVQAVSTRVLTDRVSYSAAQAVQVMSRVANLTANVVQEELRAVTVVRAAGGAVVFSQSEAIAQLAPGGQRQYSYMISASGLAAGNYSASAQLLNAQDAVLAQNTTAFSVLGTDQTGVGLAGQLKVMPSVVLIGQPVAFRLAITNNGNAALVNVPVSIRVVEPASGALVGSFSTTVANWPQGGAHDLAWSWIAQGLDGQTLLAVASANIAGRDVSLGQANIRLVGVPQLQARPAQLQFASAYLGEPGASLDTLVTSTGTATATSLQFSLSGANASQFVLPQSGCSQTASLPIGATCTLTVSYQPSDAGTHAAEVRIRYADVAEIAVHLTGQAKPILLSGSVAAEPPEVAIGQPASLTWSVSNPAAISITAHVTLSLIDSLGQTVADWPMNPNVAAGATTAGNQGYTPAITPQSLAVVLAQSISGTHTILATGTLVVTEIPVKVDPVVNIKREARILVLVSCPVRQGNVEDAACVAQRSLGISAYLHTLGIAHKVVTSQENFQRQFCCGAYNTYWLSGGAAKLSPELIGQLREAVWAGERLITDGLHDSRNQLLHGVSGIVHRGELPTLNLTASILEGSLYTPGALPTLGQPFKAELLPLAKAQAWFTQVPGQQAPVPAIVSNGYGNGASLLFAFDVAAMLTDDPQVVQPMLRDAMSVTASHSANGTQTITIGDLTAVSLSVTNQGTRTAVVEVKAGVPAGITHHSANIAPSRVEQRGGSMGTVTWTISLGSLQSSELIWRVLPQQAGVFDLPLAFYSVPERPAESARLLESRNFTLAVQQPGQLVQEATTQVQVLQPAVASDGIARTKALDAATQAASLHAQGLYPQAITRWLAAADALITIGSADIRAARDALAKALEASTDAMCAVTQQ